MNGDVSFLCVSRFFQVSWLLQKGVQTYPFIYAIIKGLLQTTNDPVSSMFPLSRRSQRPRTKTLTA
jgi:hypothetical protein